MFVFVGGVGPQETKTDVPDAQCPACGSYSLHDKRIDQVLSVFFVPLIIVHKGRSFRACSACGWDSRQEAGVGDGLSGGLPRDHDTHSLGVAGSNPELKCQQCGHTVQESFFFCPFCGSQLN